MLLASNANTLIFSCSNVAFVTVVEKSPSELSKNPCKKIIKGLFISKFGDSNNFAAACVILTFLI